MADKAIGTVFYLSPEQAQVNLSALRLLGTEIEHCPDCFVRHGERFGFRYFGNAEVCHLDKSALKQHDVLRFYVPVDNAF